MKKISALLLVVTIILTTALTTSCSLFAGAHLCDECGKCKLVDCTIKSHATKCVCDSINSELPVYGKLEGHSGFHLSIFADPAQQTVEAYQQVADLGCNWIYIDPWSGTNINTAGLAKALEACETVGLNALIMLGNAASTKKDEFRSFLDLATVDYTQYPAFKGVYVFDEPNIEQMSWIAEDMERWENSIYKDYIYFVNICIREDDKLPNDEFLEKYWEIVLSKNDDNILEFDKYPLYASVGDKVVPYLRDDGLHHLASCAYLAKEKNSSFYSYIQTYCAKDGTARDMVSVADARFQVAMNLAYGVDGFACFTYLSMSQYGDSMITPNNQKLDKYYYVQEVFSELKEFENVYFAFDYQGTITQLGPNRGTERGYGEQPEDHFNSLEHSLPSHDRIDSITTEYDLLIGTFKDKNGYDGFLITSYTDPYYMKDNNIEIDFNNASRALVYYNGSLLTNDESGSCYLLEDGVLKYDLEAGDYLFVVPIK